MATEAKPIEQPLLATLARFAAKPWRDQVNSACFRALNLIPKLRLPIRLPFGAWWLSQNDVCSQGIVHGSFETDETKFVGGFLRAGMTVLDIGAHHGYYTLLSSRKSGPTGRVISFEPSPREHGILSRHVRLNHCSNVTVENFALGNKAGETDLFMVEGAETGFNSLRPPSISVQTSKHKIRVERLDDYLEAKRITRVDFIKLDAEGGELEILRGAAKLLEGRNRPVILAEVQDVRTEPWGYEAREIIEYASAKGFHWFRLLPGGELKVVSPGQRQFDGNFVGVPPEKLTMVTGINTAANVVPLSA
jgi:FkbM family methyltransferase